MPSPATPPAGSGQEERLAEIRGRAERTQALAPLDRAPVGEWPAIVLEVCAALADALAREEQLRELLEQAEVDMERKVDAELRATLVESAAREKRLVELARNARSQAAAPDYDEEMIWDWLWTLVAEVLAPSRQAQSSPSTALARAEKEGRGVSDLDVRHFDLRRLRQEAFDLDHCGNGPDEEGNWPCDPQVIYGGGWAECAVCGRQGRWPAHPPEQSLRFPDA